MNKVRVGLIGLGEAGNFGDDLILIAASQALDQSFNDVEIQYVGFGEALNWEEVAGITGMSAIPRPVIKPKVDLPGSTKFSRVHENCDAVIFGGGGLLQTSHHPERPYHWLRYLPRDTTIPVVAVGLGLGPLNEEWASHFAQLGIPFNACYLRDRGSLEYAETRLHWAGMKPCRDFVDKPFLQSLIGKRHETEPLSTVLGVSLRKWPSLSVTTVAEHIDETATKEGVTTVVFFVLESKGGKGTDVDFTEQVAERVSIPSEICVYSGHNLVQFSRSMIQCKAAISMKLHSSAVWAAFDIPIYPIVYAPKIASFFGLAYHGLEIGKDVVRKSPDPRAYPRASDVLRRIAIDVVGKKKWPTRARFSRFKIFDLQVRSASRAVWRRVKMRRRK